MGLFDEKQILITAGPTREALDPVRYLSNYSSGKMGFALAEAFLNEGAFVNLISGPVSLRLTHDRLIITKIESAAEMRNACLARYAAVNICVFAAAVADYRPQTIATEKIKKDSEEYFVRLVKTIDIAQEFGRIKRNDQFSIGFALETNDILANARNKLTKKNFDLIVLNSPLDPGAAFGHDTNKVTILSKDGLERGHELKSKQEVAQDILKAIAALQ